MVYMLNKATQILKERKEVSIAGLSFRLGYSPEYFKRAILPIMVELSDCIDVEGNKVVWTCMEEEKEGIHEELNELSILRARPIGEEERRSEVDWGPHRKKEIPKEAEEDQER